MHLKDLTEITTLAAQYRNLSGAIRQTEICHSQPWVCGAGGHSINVEAAAMDKVFIAMRDKIEQKMRVLGVTDFWEGY